MTKDKCKACGVAWDEHKGIEGTCKDLQACLSALKVIHTWAAYDCEHGYMALLPEHVRDLVNRTLNDVAGRRG
jgi:hypothetical protein